MYRPCLHRGTTIAVDQAVSDFQLVVTASVAAGAAASGAAAALAGNPSSA